MHERILILDYGSQYTQLIARRVREAGVYCEIYPCTRNFGDIAAFSPVGLILSGGPASVYDEGAPELDERVLSLKKDDGEPVPVLGICYGLQAIANIRGGQVERAPRREYGRAKIEITQKDTLFADIKNGENVWMSHSDHLTKLPNGFDIIAKTDNAPIAAVKAADALIYGVQFHPEVVHTPSGPTLLRNFVRNICNCAGDWTPASFVDDKIAEIKKTVGHEHVILGLSGGVDSSVAAVLLNKALGDQLTCVFVNNGLLRKNEFEQVQETFRSHYDIRLNAVDASDLFLDRLAGVSDPEKKRKIIGATFIEVFQQATESIVKELGQKPKFLAQGTLYPDVIESVSFKGPSVTIKSHHNVGGLPEKLGFDLLEPFRELFKDEVREVGRVLNVPNTLIERHPFPGPGLAVRILGDIRRPAIALLQEADAIFIEELHKQNLYHETWQAFAVLLPIKTVGVMGDERTYENACALRAVTSVDGMTADWAHLPHQFLAHVSSRIINEVKGINRVVYDITSKPPGTIEWE